jgi:hypothetical protein
MVGESDILSLSEVFRLEERGTIDLKGTGPMNTWFLTGRTASDPRLPQSRRP